jgi:transposase
MRAIGGEGRHPWSAERLQGEGRCVNSRDPLRLLSTTWVLAVQLPGVDRHSRHVLDAGGEGLVSFVERLKARCALAGRKIARVILTHEAGRDGFWLARFLTRRGIEVHVMRPSSLPVDRRARRAKTDMIDAEMLLRTLMAWLRVCSMVPIPSEVDEEARRAHREREDLTGERRLIVNKIGGILATLVFTCRRLARTGEPARRNDSILLRVEIGAMAAPSGSEAAETVAPGDERTPNEVRRHRNRTLAARRIASRLVHRSVRSLPRPMPATPFISAALTAVYTDRVYDHFITPQHVIKVSLNCKSY